MTLNHISTVSRTPTAAQTAEDINLISAFLANEPRNTSLEQLNPSIIILCGNAILHTSHVIFRYLQQNKLLSIHTLVIAGGIGHSTSHLYDAVRRHPTYGPYFQSTDQTGGNNLARKAEAVVLNEIRKHFYPTSNFDVKVLVEDQSTNCGANAECARKVLEQNGILLGKQKPEKVVIVQDPTMSLRTLKCFEKTYADVLDIETSTSSSKASVRFATYPTFTPAVRPVSGSASGAVQDGIQQLEWDASALCTQSVTDLDGLWQMNRFYGLLLGEIPRLRDDEAGYGPKGKGFIGHVDVPKEVEDAWKRLETVLEVKR